MVFFQSVLVYSYFFATAPCFAIRFQRDPCSTIIKKRFRTWPLVTRAFVFRVINPARGAV